MSVRIWVDGRRVDDGAAALSPLDHGVTVGDGVFETAKVENGRVFALDLHHDRMDRSLAGLGMPPLDRDRINAGIAAVLADGLIDFGRLRYTITGGVGPLGSDRGDAPPTYIVTASAVPRPTATTKVATVHWTRNENSAVVGLKTTSYAENVVCLAEAKSVGGSEALMANTLGNLCEGTGSNVFVAVGGELVTPPLEDGPLAGITRALVIAWAREAGMRVAEESLSFDVLGECDEAFLTSSTRDVQGIHAIGDRVLCRQGSPGPLTLAASRAFRERQEALFTPPVSA